MAELILTGYGFVSVQLFCRAIQNALLLPYFFGVILIILLFCLTTLL